MLHVLDGLPGSPGISFELVHDGARTRFFLKCWHGDQFFKLNLATYDRHTKFPAGEVTILSQFLACLPSAIPVVSLVRFPIQFKTVLDKHLSLPTTLISVSSFDFDDLKYHLRGPTSRLFGKADMFGLIEYLIIRLQTASGEPWMTSGNHLRIVGPFLFF